ncbi:MAG TPA: HAD-IA family hydrolase [Polyangiales bacterium]
MEPRGLLLDLDDTLYGYVPVERHARAAVLSEISRDLCVELAEAGALYDAARQRVKKRLGKTGAAHSRLLYLLDLASSARAPLSLPRKWERTFWGEYLRVMEPHPGVRELLAGWRALGNRTAIVTDLVVDIQLQKLEKFSLLELIDAIVVSEEVPLDKPAPEIFELACARLGVPRERCVMVGDNDAKDGAGARALGIPFLQVRGTEPDANGLTLQEVARELGVPL